MKLYLGLPFYAVKNKKRLEFIEWIGEHEWLEEEEEDDDTEAMKIARILSQWFQELSELYETIKDTDLDQKKKGTVDQEYKEIRNFQCENIKWVSCSDQ